MTNSLSSMPGRPLPQPKKRKPAKKRSLPPATRSGRLYVTIAPSKVHLFRYFLEAEDNLALMTVVDRWRAALMVRFSPHQEAEVRACLARMKSAVPFEGPFVIAQDGG